jgi:hypothetical protein
MTIEDSNAKENAGAKIELRTPQPVEPYMTELHGNYNTEDQVEEDCRSDKVENAAYAET